MGARTYWRRHKRRRLTGAGDFGCACNLLSDGGVLAQDVSLPQINVTDTRLTGIGSPGRGGGSAPSVQGTSVGHRAGG